MGRSPSLRSGAIRVDVEYLRAVVKLGSAAWIVPEHGDLDAGHCRVTL